MKRLFKIVAIFAATGAALWVVSRVLYARRRTKTEEVPDQPFFERRSEPDPDSLAAMTSGNFDRIGLDVGRLKELESNNYKPLVQYLTAIQVKRGEMGETLLFVRQRDLDALAELSGDSPEGFKEQFRELGILMSMN